MEKIVKNLFSLLVFALSLASAQAQQGEGAKTSLQKEASAEVLRKIELSEFSNEIGLEMGLAIVKLANHRNQKVAVKVERLNHTIFLYVNDGLPVDKHNWLRRKANISKHFEESSLSIKHDLINGNMTLDKTFALDNDNYLAKGGAIPIFVKGAGMIAVITVSGLHDAEDHKIIIDGLKGTFIK